LLLKDGFSALYETADTQREWLMCQSLGVVWRKKLNLTQQQHALVQQSRKMTNKSKHRNLKPASVAFYDTRPGNGAGPFSKEEISKEKVKKKV